MSEYRLVNPIISEVKTLVEEERFREALACVEKELNAEISKHSKFELLSLRCFLFRHAGAEQKALADADECIKLGPEEAKGYVLKAEVLNSLKQFADAINVVKLGLARCSERSELEKLKRLVEGRIELKKAKESLGKGDSRKSIHLFTNLLRQPTAAVADADLFKVRLHRSRAFVSERKWQEALEDARECVRMSPKDARAWTALSTAYDGMGRMQEARAAYYKSLDLGKKDEGEMFLKDFDKMEKLHQRGNALFYDHQFKEAEACYSEAIELNQSLSIVDAWEERFKGKITAKKRLQKLAELFSNRSSCYLARSEYKSAISDAKECLKVAPNWSRAHFRLGSALFESVKHADVADSYSRNDAGDLRDLIRAERSLKKGYELAPPPGDQACFEKLSELHEFRSESLRAADEEEAKARRLFAASNFSSAAARLENALHLTACVYGKESSEVLDRLRDIADLNDVIGNYEATIPIRIKLMQAKPMSMVRAIDLALAYKNCKQHESAVFVFKQVLNNLNTQCPEGTIEEALAMNEIAGCYREMNEPQHAYHTLQLAVELSRRLGGDVSSLYAMTLQNLLIILNMMGTRPFEAQELKKRASKLLRHMPAKDGTEKSVFALSLDIWMTTEDVFHVNRWPNRVFRTMPVDVDMSSMRSSRGSESCVTKSVHEEEAHRSLLDLHLTPRLVDDSAVRRLSVASTPHTRDKLLPNLDDGSVKGITPTFAAGHRDGVSSVATSVESGRSLSRVERMLQERATMRAAQEQQRAQTRPANYIR